MTWPRMTFQDVCQAIMETREHKCDSCGDTVSPLLLRNFHKKTGIGACADVLDSVVIVCDDCNPKKNSTLIETGEVGA